MSLQSNQDTETPESFDWWRKPMLLGFSLFCVIGVHWYILQ